MKDFFNQWWQAIQLGWNILTLSAFLFLLIWLFSYLSTFSHDVARSLESCDAAVCKSSDSFAIAAELGRLDILTLGLTIFSVVVAFVAVFAFFHIREKAMVVSQEIAAEISKKFAEEVAEKVTKKIASEIAQIESTKAAKIVTEAYLLGPSFKIEISNNLTKELDKRLLPMMALMSINQEHHSANADADADAFSDSMMNEPRGN